MRRMLLLPGVLAVILLGAFTTAAVAAAPAPFQAVASIAVTGISAPIPAGHSGRVRIESESVAGGIIYGPASLAGKALSMNQKSNELFSSPDITTAVVIDGTAEGTFSVIDPITGSTVASGRYHSEISNSPQCQILDEGHWSTTGGSEIKGRGTLSACLNWNASFGTFVGAVTFSGTLQ
ncbi:MAG: hypothetical protein HY672_04645 [Chloroflexi bacterium]|nr:hypothetical protein [Chloroflexota bacterium]